MVTISQKENDNFLATKPPNMENCDLTDKESKIIVMKKSNDFRIKLMDRSPLPKTLKF